MDDLGHSAVHFFVATVLDVSAEFVGLDVETASVAASALLDQVLSHGFTSLEDSYAHADVLCLELWHEDDGGVFADFGDAGVDALDFDVEHFFDGGLDLRLCRGASDDELESVLLFHLHHGFLSDVGVEDDGVGVHVTWHLRVWRARLW